MDRASFEEAFEERVRDESGETKKEGGINKHCRKTRTGLVIPAQEKANDAVNQIRGGSAKGWVTWLRGKKPCDFWRPEFEQSLPRELTSFGTVSIAVGQPLYYGSARGKDFG